MTTFFDTSSPENISFIKNHLFELIRSHAIFKILNLMNIAHIKKTEQFVENNKKNVCI